jgi:hypothetical protein
LSLLDINRHGKLILGVVLGVLTVFSGLHLMLDYRAHWREREQHIVVTTDAVAQYVKQVFTIIDLTLQTVDDDRGGNEIVVFRSPPQLHETLKHAQAASPAIAGLGVVGRDGVVVASASSPDQPKVDLSDRDYFIAHRNDPNLGLLVSRPVITRPQNTVAVKKPRK